MGEKINHIFTDDNLEFRMFGVPKGYSASIMPQDNSADYEYFYYGQKEPVLFRVRKREGNKIEYIYTRTKKGEAIMLDADHRAGSFFGMALELSDVYCDKNIKLYNLFDSVFDNIIVGDNSIIKKQNNAYKYNLPYFDREDTNQLKMYFKDRLNEYFSQDFKSLKEFVIHSNELRTIFTSKS